MSDKKTQVERKKWKTAVAEKVPVYHQESDPSFNAHDLSDEVESRDEERHKSSIFSSAVNAGN